jgi:hypothetical protein
VGLVAAAAVVFSVIATAVLASQDQDLVVGTVLTATSTDLSPRLPSPSPLVVETQTHQAAPVLSPSPASLSPTGQPRPSPTTSPTMSPTAEPTWTLLPSPTLTARPTLESQSPAVPAGRCSPPEDWREYEVKHTQTARSLAGYLGTSASELRDANCLKGDIIPAGTVLWAPKREAMPQPSSTPKPTQKSVRQPTKTPQPRLKPVLRGDRTVVLPEVVGGSSLLLGPERYH